MSAIAYDSHTTAEVLVMMARNMGFGCMGCGRIQMRKLLRQEIKTPLLVYYKKVPLSRGELNFFRLGCHKVLIYRLASLRH